MDTDIDTRAGRVNPAEKEKTMKINSRTEMREVTIKEYIAEDGKVFDTEQACREHEEMMADNLKARYDAIPRREEYAESCMLPTWYASDSIVHIIRVRNEQDVQTVNEWVELYDNDTRGLTTSDIGRVVMLVYEEYYSYENSAFCDVLFYEEDVLKQAQEFWQNISKAEI